MNDPLVVNGVRFPNKTRAQDAQLAHDAHQAFLAAGGVVVQVEPGVAAGNKKTKYVKAKAAGGKARVEPLVTGDKKFDMYLNALPGPIRANVLERGLDPRELYKEYRKVGREDLIAKYS